MSRFTFLNDLTYSVNKTVALCRRKPAFYNLYLVWGKTIELFGGFILSNMQHLAGHMHQQGSTNSMQIRRDTHIQSQQQFIERNKKNNLDKICQNKSHTRLITCSIWTKDLQVSGVGLNWVPFVFLLFFYTFKYW